MPGPRRTGRQAREAAERATREAEERRRLEEEARLRRIEDEKNAREREDKLRLQEAERRARVEGEVRIQKRRCASRPSTGPSIRRSRRAHVRRDVVVIGGGLGYKMYSQHQAEIAAQGPSSPRSRPRRPRSRRRRPARRPSSGRRWRGSRRTWTRVSPRRRTTKSAIGSAPRRPGARPRSSAHHGPAKGEKETPAAPAIRNFKKREISDSPLDGLGL